MGLFLELSSIINRTESEVTESLKNYLQTIGGEIEPARLSSNHQNFCAVTAVNGNCTIMYPADFLHWEEASEFISKDLGTAVFSFHIHDGDLWMYHLYVSGKVKDHFCPIPEYWYEEKISKAEADSWRGSAETLARYVPGIKPQSVSGYLVHWDAERADEKAYPDDEYPRREWQLLDFMRKLRLPYPISPSGRVNGEVYQFWTKDLPLAGPKPLPAADTGTPEPDDTKKPWWKLW